MAPSLLVVFTSVGSATACATGLASGPSSALQLAPRPGDAPHNVGIQCQLSKIESTGVCERHIYWGQGLEQAGTPDAALPSVSVSGINSTSAGGGCLWTLTRCGSMPTAFAILNPTPSPRYAFQYMHNMMLHNMMTCSETFPVVVSRSRRQQERRPAIPTRSTRTPNPDRVRPVIVLEHLPRRTLVERLYMRRCGAVPNADFRRPL